MIIKQYNDYEKEIMPKYYMVAFERIIKDCKKLPMVEKIYKPSKPILKNNMPMIVVKYDCSDELYMLPLIELVSKERQRNIISNIDNFIPMHNIDYTAFDYTKTDKLTEIK